MREQAIDFRELLERVLPLEHLPAIDRFQVQRALMSGGTCEGTAYQEFGFQTAAVCVALGNYHNCHPGGWLAPEFVSLSDACDMVELLVEAARQLRAFARHTGRLPARLARLLKQARRNLQRNR